MRSLHKRGIVASMEEEEQLVEQAQEVVELATELGENADSLETELVELVEDIAEQEGEEVQTAEGEEVAAELETMADAVEETVENGGLDQNAAQILEIAVESMYNRVGISTKKRSLPSLESFGATSSRIRATQISVEDMREKAATIYKAIIAQFQKAIEWAVNFFKQVFDLAGKLQARAKDMKTKAAAFKGAPSAATVENGRIFKALAVGDSVPDNLSAALDNVIINAKIIFERSDDNSKTAETLAKELASGNFKGYFESKLQLQPGTNGASTDVAGAEAPAGLKVTRSTEMLGNTAVFYTLPAKSMSGQEALDAIGHISAKVDSMKEGAGEAKPIKTVDGAEGAKLAAGVEQLAGLLLGYKAKQAAVATIKKQCINVANSLMKAAGAQEEGAAKDIAAAKATLSYVVRTIDQPASSFSKYVLTTGKEVLNLIELSLKTAPAAKEAPAAEKPAAEPAAA